MRTISAIFLGFPLSFLAACGGTEPPPNVPPAATGAPTTGPPATTAPRPATPEKPAVSSACPGKVDTHDGLQEVTDEALLKQALGEPGKGSLCTGKVFQAVKPVTVYRV